MYLKMASAESSSETLTHGKPLLAFPGSIVKKGRQSPSSSELATCHGVLHISLTRCGLHSKNSVVPILVGER
jgi:hypothetical protein